MARGDTAPHPTLLRKVTFSREQEKEWLQTFAPDMHGADPTLTCPMLHD